MAFRNNSHPINDKIVAIGHGRPQVAPTDGNTNEYVGQGLAPAVESKNAALIDLISANQSRKLKVGIRYRVASARFHVPCVRG